MHEKAGIKRILEMIFGYSTNAFVRHSLDHAVETITGLGFKGVEIMGDKPHLYPPDYDEKSLSLLKRRIEAHHLKITNINSFTLFAVGDTYLPSWIEPEKTRREIRIQHTLNSMKTAAFLGCKTISIPPGGPMGILSRKKACGLFHEGLEKVIPLAERLGIKLLIEPEPGLLIENTKEFKEFISRVKSPWVGINFDIGHFFCAGEDPAASFETLFEWVGHMHLEDIAENRIHRHLIPGHGAIDFLSVFKCITRLGYQGDMSLELYPYVETPAEAGRESLLVLEPLFAEAGLSIR
ncbi:MAG: sugar phosphate isomerase/epimerase family protein [Thermodesulfobacteriota bacterium]